MNISALFNKVEDKNLKKSGVSNLGGSSQYRGVRYPLPIMDKA